MRKKEEPEVMVATCLESTSSVSSAAGNSRMMLKSRRAVENHMACEAVNPGILGVATSYRVGPVDDPEFVTTGAHRRHRP